MDKTILVLRHAKSDWTTGDLDYDRPLTVRGRRDAQVVGQLMRLYDIDLVWCSGARRTQQTWEQACLGGADAKLVDVRKSFYMTWADELIDEMRILDESIATLAIINHQPTVGSLVSELAKQSSLRTQVIQHFPTAGLAILSYAGIWQALGAGQCGLLSLSSI